MKPIDIYIRFSDQNIRLAKAATLQLDGNLVYKDEGSHARAHAVTLVKLTSLTILSPLVCLARLVRSVAFALTGKFKRAGSEFIGGLGISLVASTCLFGTLASASISLITWGNVSFYTSMRKSYAYFEAWTNGIDLRSPELASYSQRVSHTSNVLKKNWTTAPCMQPILEHGTSSQGGLLDAERMKKLFPFTKINGMHEENGKIVIQSEYINSITSQVSCCGARKHAKIETTCCCLHIEAIYDRLFCCEVGQGNCSTVCTPSDSTGVYYCTFCGIGVCCCTERVDNVDLGVTSTNCLCPC